jgi:hypothetical protein
VVEVVHTSIAMVLEQFAVTLEILESLLYFITLATSRCVPLTAAFAGSFFLRGLFLMHGSIDYRRIGGLDKIEWKHSTLYICL